jgi:hypothetical protein
MRCSISTLALLGVLLSSPTLFGQYSNTGNGGTSTSGAFGTRTLGGGVSNPTSSAFGSSALGQSATTGSSGQLTGNERFLRENRQGAFVGADSGDSANVFSQQQGAGQGNQFNNLLGQQGLFSQLNRLNQQNARNNSRSAQSKLRFLVRADDDLTISTGPQFNGANATTPAPALAARLARLPALQNLPPVQVTLRDRTAIVSGTVPSERAKRLVAGVLLLEPGVGDVQNELIVDQAASNAEPLPPPQ